MKNLEGNQSDLKNKFLLDFVLSSLSDLKAEHRSKTQNHKENTSNVGQDFAQNKKMTLSDYKEELKIKKVGNQNVNNDGNAPTQTIEEENKIENVPNNFINANNYQNFQNPYSYNNYYNYNMPSYYPTEHFTNPQSFNIPNNYNNCYNEMKNNFSVFNNKNSQIPLNAEETQYYKKIFDFLTDGKNEKTFLESRPVADFLKTSNLQKVNEIDKHYLC